MSQAPSKDLRGRYSRFQAPRRFRPSSMVIDILCEKLWRITQRVLHRKIHIFYVTRFFWRNLTSVSRCTHWRRPGRVYVDVSLSLVLIHVWLGLMTEKAYLTGFFCVTTAGIVFFTAPIFEQITKGHCWQGCNLASQSEYMRVSENSMSAHLEILYSTALHWGRLGWFTCRLRRR